MDNERLTWIALTENLRQTNGMINGGVPCGRLEGKLCVSLVPVWDGRQLEEVACNDKLNPSPGSPVVANRASDLSQLVEKVSINHGDLVDYEGVGSEPPVLRLCIPTDLFDQGWNIFFSKSDTSKAMQRRAPDIASCQTG